jgi:competence protein ComEA
MVPSSRGATLAVACAVLFCVLAFHAAAADPRSGDETEGPRPVDLNTANVEQLVAVPGVGETMALRIIEWREEHGPFQRIEDLMKIKGIGERSLERLRPHVKVSHPSD